MKTSIDTSSKFTEHAPAFNDSFRRVFSKKLAHYARKIPKSFLQIDGEYTHFHGDDSVHPDKDGDWISADATIELMSGSTVRVLIPADTDPKIAVRQLKKITKWLKRKPELIEFAVPLDFSSEYKADDSENLPF